MKDKSIKQPWPRSARVTVWVLGILLFIASANVWLLCEKVQEYSQAFRVAQSDFPTFGDYVISGGKLDTIRGCRDLSFGNYLTLE